MHNDRLGQHNKKPFPWSSMLPILIVAAIAGWVMLNPNVTPQASAAPQENQPASKGMAVPVAEIVRQDIQVWNIFSARLEAVNEVDIRPQVSGQITRIYFEEGGLVEEGDLLLSIDPLPFEAAVSAAQAQVASNQSRRALARRNYQRAEELFANNAISRKVLDERKNQLDLATHAITAAEATLTQAEVNLDRANIRAPISGRISRPELTVGNLVQAGPGAPLLTSIVNNDMIFAEFDIDDQTYLNYIYSPSENVNKLQEIPVSIHLAGQKNRSVTGFLYSFDNQVNQDTGTVRVRAIFENPNGRLLPGMYAEVRMASPDTDQQIAVPKSAIQIDQDRRFVYVVNGQSTAEYREVELGQGTNSHVIILSGLNTGERIVINTFGMVRPNTPIDPQPASILLPEGNKGS